MEQKGDEVQSLAKVQIIAAMSGKGGVGKTSLLINVAHFSAFYGVKVLFVDCDLGTNGATIFVSMKYPLKGKKNVITIQDLLASLVNESEGRDSGDVDAFVPFPLEKNLDFIPASLANNLLKEEELTEERKKKILPEFQAKVNEWEKHYEIIFFDLGAGYNNFIDFFINVVNTICIVDEGDRLSYEAASECRDKVAKNCGTKSVINCINKWEMGDRSGMRGVKGFPNSKEYAKKFKQGDMFEVTGEKSVKILINISETLLRNEEELMNKIKKNRKKRKKIEKRRQVNISILIVFIFTMVIMLDGLFMYSISVLNKNIYWLCGIIIFFSAGLFGTICYYLISNWQKIKLNWIDAIMK